MKFDGLSAVRLRSKTFILFSFLVLIAYGTMSCNKDDNDDDNNDQYSQIHGTKPLPAWGPDLTQQMQAVIEALDTLVPIPPYTLQPVQVRMLPSAADAAKRVQTHYNIPDPPINVDTTGNQVPVSGGTIHVRIYTPTSGKSSYPVIVYYHGGGFVIATVDTYNASAQALAEQADAIVVSVEYRKAPEFKFPTAHNDAFTAYKWVLANAYTFKGDTAKVAVAGESAGGNLAVAISMMARDSSIKLPLYIVSVYPIANSNFATPSYVQYADAEPLSLPFAQWFFSYYLNTPTEGTNPLLSLATADLTGLPPTLIINAEIDPLQSDGELLYNQMMKDGVTASRVVYTGVTHEFFGMATVIPEAKVAQALAAANLKAALK